MSDTSPLILHGLTKRFGLLVRMVRVKARRFGR